MTQDKRVGPKRRSKRAEAKQARARQGETGESYTTSLSRIREKRLRQLEGRQAVAKELVAAGRFDEAVPHYEWVWQRSRLAPEWSGVRVSFFLTQLTTLVRSSPVGRATFARLRDVAARKVSTSPDWFALNRALGEEARTLEYFDREKGRLTAAKLKEQWRWLIDPIKQAERWSDLALLFPNPVAKVEEEFEFHLFVHARTLEMADRLPPRALQWNKENYLNQWRALVEDIARGYLAAGNRAEALRVAARARELDPSEALKALLDRVFPVG